MAQTGLTGEQFGQLLDAIVVAYPDPQNLKMALRAKFNGLNITPVLTQAFTYRQQMGQLIEWVEAQGKVKELVRALRDPTYGMPTNDALKAFDESLGGKTTATLADLFEKLTNRN